MLNLAFIFHMHQPYYKNLLTQEITMPWVRLHGVKDYLDMVQILEKYPSMHQTFNLVPSLLEQIEDYVNNTGKDKFLELSFKPASNLTKQEKEFILERFFMINKERAIAMHPRYYELYFKKQRKIEFSTQDYLDLQVWFNLAWTDPYFRQSAPELKALVNKGRFFSEEEKQLVLNKQLEILKEIIPAYRRLMSSGQIEVTISPFYHPILPLLYNTKIAKEAYAKSTLPKVNFSYPEDAKAQIDAAVSLFQEKFKASPQGMWPSEESVSEHILPLIMQSGINWIVADEAILFKSLKKKKRDTALLYQPHLLKRKDGNLNIIFRDRNLSDLLGFEYFNWSTEAAVADLLKHLKNIADAFKDKDILVTIAMDGENAWEYYPNDGHDFLELLYKNLSEAPFLKTVTISEYLLEHAAKSEVKHLVAGSWIFADFSKWINNPYKNKAWEYLSIARKELEGLPLTTPNLQLAYKQMYIAEGSDWFWWYGENQEDFDSMFRMHLSNFYTLINKEVPEYLKRPLSP
jgi:alpha-amylase/alpha-mannosidase (GH57 family)